MANHVEIKNLSVLFGKPRQKEIALQMIEDNVSSDEIRKKTGVTVAVRNVSFEIEENELFVIVGLSGSGKSSLIRTVNLLNKPASGKVIVDGQDIVDMSKEELRAYRRKDVSMVFQHFGLLDHRSVLNNVAYPLEVQGIDKEERAEKAMETIEMVGLKGWEHHKPNQLSGGMKQRVGLARALTNNPKLLLMDEPYSALDPLIRREMQNELLNLENDMDRTIIFITHDMNEAFKMGDRIALMKDGEIVQLGKPMEFFDHPANDYVRSFIADVDKTRILKVRKVMRKPFFIGNPKDSVDKVLKVLNENKKEYCFVTDDKKYYLGYVTKIQLENTEGKTIKDLIIKDENTIQRNVYLREAWGSLNESSYDVAVVDSKNRLRGVLDNDEVSKVLAI